jgi:hypothetical protein
MERQGIMSNEGGFRNSAPVERIDADAVCERCGSVNPEDTLLCKTCGNNLRDQRARRIGAGLAVDTGEGTPSRAALFKGIAAAVGLLVLLLVAINIGRIEDYMVRAQSARSGDVTAYWSGALGREFNKLAQELKEKPSTPEEREAVMRQPSAGDTYEGRYVLAQKGSIRELPMGDAIIRKAGDTFRFVAIFDGSQAELRGEGLLEMQTRIASRDTAAVYLDGTYYPASGFAQPAANGALECLGLCEIGPDSYSAVAYRIP